MHPRFKTIMWRNTEKSSYCLAYLPGNSVFNLQESRWLKASTFLVGLVSVLKVQPSGTLCPKLGSNKFTPSSDRHCCLAPRRNGSDSQQKSSSSCNWDGVAQPSQVHHSCHPFLRKGSSKTDIFGSILLPIPPVVFLHVAISRIHIKINKKFEDTYILEHYIKSTRRNWLQSQSERLSLRFSLLFSKFHPKRVQL